MDIHILSDEEAVAQEAAKEIARVARQTIAENGRCVMAVSGGKTPWEMLRILGTEDIPWENVHIVQVDERIAPAGDPDRNLTHLRESLLNHTPIDPKNIHAMPVEDEDLEAAAEKYTQTLQQISGTPIVLDLVHLGMGPDGHTASLIPGDPVLEVTDTAVALTGVYQGRHRMTLTYPTINRARKVIWVITGSTKVESFRRFRDGDQSIPSGRINKEHAMVFADKAADGETNLPAGKGGKPV